jgi:hypothetical protein
MPRLSQRARLEWSLFIGENRRRQYNGLCRRCNRDCKQSFRAAIIDCPRFMVRLKKA